MAIVSPAEAAADVAERILLSSDAFAEGEPIPAQYTCDGRDMSPALSWRDVPNGTAELVVTMEDPDAADQVFVHWMLAGIDPTSPGILQGGLPEGATEGLNDFGDAGWKGPCPPWGHAPHRYVFTVLALQEHTELPYRFTAEQLRETLDRSVILARGVLVGRYGRTPRPPVKSG